MCGEELCNPIWVLLCSVFESLLGYLWREVLSLQNHCVEVFVKLKALVRDSILGSHWRCSGHVYSVGFHSDLFLRTWLKVSEYLCRLTTYLLVVRNKIFTTNPWSPGEGCCASGHEKFSTYPFLQQRTPLIPWLHSPPSVVSFQNPVETRTKIPSILGWFIDAS